MRLSPIIVSNFCPSSLLKNPPDLQNGDRSQLPFSYREFLAERDEILKNKRILSQRAGHDVDFDSALMDWVTNHRANWMASRARQNAVA